METPNHIRLQEKILDVFKDTEVLYQEEDMILKTIIPDEIWDEVIVMKTECDLIRNQKYSFLFEHLNAGENDYQMSVPKSSFEKSFIFPFLIHMGQYYLYKHSGISILKSSRCVFMKTNDYHFDGFDFWINYATKGSKNPLHAHKGSLSGVIYYQNTEQVPTRFNGGIEIFGKPKEIVMFPSQLNHEVDEVKHGERITFAYNLGVSSVEE